MSRKEKKIRVTVPVSPATYAKMQYQALRRRHGDDHPEILRAAQEVARALGDRPEDQEESIETYQNVMWALWDSRGPDDPWFLEVVHDAAKVVFRSGDLARAEEMFQAALDGRERVLGRNHRDSLASAEMLGRVLTAVGRPAEAEALHRDVLDRRCRATGGDADAARVARLDVARSLLAQGRAQEAAVEFRALTEEAERDWGPQDPRTAGSRSNLAGALFELGELEEAARMFRAGLAAESRDDGTGHNNLATVLFFLDRFEEAEDELRQALALKERHYGRDALETMQSVENLARVVARRGDRTEARALAQRCLAVYRRSYPAHHPRISGLRELLD
ncbi:tetratricopeptide repeat protein [Actinoplanes sp. NPDC026623]|uniref:tetratricopeptide repeat protein n=1 Tax=Actinoplanes sp. NPDC026623 TaxID=3155610 RepID=UPI0033D67D12